MTSGSIDPESVPHSTTHTSEIATVSPTNAVRAIEVKNATKPRFARSRSSENRASVSPERSPGDDAPPIARADFPEGQGANDQRCRLRTRIAAAGNNQRHEQRQHDGLRISPQAPWPTPSAFLPGTAPSTSRRASAPCRTRLDVRLVERLEPPILWISLVAAASATSSTSSIVTMPMSIPAVPSPAAPFDRTGETCPRHPSGRPSPSARRTVDPLVGARAVQRGEQQLADTNVVHQHARSSTTYTTFKVSLSWPCAGCNRALRERSTSRERSRSAASSAGRPIAPDSRAVSVRRNAPQA